MKFLRKQMMPFATGRTVIAGASFTLNDLRNFCGHSFVARWTILGQWVFANILNFVFGRISVLINKVNSTYGYEGAGEKTKKGKWFQGKESEPLEVIIQDKLNSNVSNNTTKNNKYKGHSFQQCSIFKSLEELCSDFRQVHCNDSSLNGQGHWLVRLISGHPILNKFQLKLSGY